MTVTTRDTSGTKEYYGLSGDSKPAATAGAAFYETDTGIVSLYSGSAWSTVNTRLGNVAIRGPKPWADVMAYGATGDGATDDTAAIAAAITVASLSSAAVYFPIGTYKTTSTLTISSTLQLLGQGVGSVIALSTSTSNSVPALTVTGTNVIIGNLKLLGTNAGQNRAVVATSASDLTLRDVLITGFKGRNDDTGGIVDLATCDRAKLIDCRIMDSFAGTGLAGDRTRGIYATACDYLIIDRCRVENHGFEGMFLDTNNDYAIIRGSQWYDCGKATVQFGSNGLLLAIKGGTGHQVEHNRFLGHPGGASSVYGEESFEYSGCTASAFRNNYLISAKLAGIHLFNCDGCSVTGNISTANGQHGMIGKGVRDTLVEGNVFNANTNDGIRLIASTGGSARAGQRVQVVGNILTDNTSNALLIGSGETSHVVRENKTAGAGGSSFINNSGTSTRIYGNEGHNTERTGTATITAGQTSIAFNHSLSAAPARVEISPTTDTLGKRLWTSAKGASQITVSIDSTGVSDITFDWRALVTEHV